MTAKQLQTAIDLGFTTQKELKAFEFGIMAAETEAAEKHIKEMQEEKTVMEDQLSWLNPEWQPRTVHMHTNRRV